MKIYKDKQFLVFDFEDGKMSNMILPPISSIQSMIFLNR